jgi:hypothetical protein
MFVPLLFQRERGRRRAVAAVVTGGSGGDGEFDGDG